MDERGIHRAAESIDALVAAKLQAWQEGLAAMHLEASTANPPRRFSLCDEYPDRENAIVFAWGLAFDDEAVLYRPNSSDLVIASSAESGLRLFSRIADLRLVWVDPQPEPGSA